MRGRREAALHTVREEPDADDPRYHCAWIDAPEPNGPRLSLLIGDCLQCLRSALDHLAFELASEFTVPMTDDIEKSSSFPILDDIDKRGHFGVGPQKWKSYGSQVTRGMDPRAQAEIERLQPYRRGCQFTDDPFWHLHLLNNIDKHRSQGTGPLTIADDIEVKGRTQIARWPAVPIDPRQEMKVGFIPTLDIAFDFRTPLVGGDNAVETLSEIHRYIVRNVLLPLAAYLK